MMNNSSSASFELTVLAVPDWLAYSLIAVYSVVIIFASLGSILIITAVSRTKSNVYIGMQNSFFKLCIVRYLLQNKSLQTFILFARITNYRLYGKLSQRKFLLKVICCNSA